jgi:hypothetical protein
VSLNRESADPWGSGSCTQGVRELSRFYSFFFLPYCCKFQNFITFFYFHIGIKNMTTKMYPLSIFYVVCILLNQNVWDNSGEGVRGTRKVEKRWSVQYKVIPMPTHHAMKAYSRRGGISTRWDRDIAASRSDRVIHWNTAPSDEIGGRADTRVGLDMAVKRSPAPAGNMIPVCRQSLYLGSFWPVCGPLKLLQCILKCTSETRRLAYSISYISFPNK